jgi:hypothetical protein
LVTEPKGRFQEQTNTVDTDFGVAVRQESRVWFGQPASRWTTTVWVILVLGMCLHFALTYSNIIDYLDLKAYMVGAEKTPYQYRILMMWVFQLLAPSHFVLATERHIEHMHIPPLFKSPQQLVQLGVAMVCMVAAVLATTGTLVRLTGDRVYSRWISLLIVYMAYFDLAPGWGLSYTYPYDVPSLMFFCLGVYLVVSGRDWLYYAVFPIATLNRETTCFLILFFVVWKWQELRARTGYVTWKEILSLLGHGAVQAAIWVGLKLWLLRRFAANPYDYGLGKSDHMVLDKLKFNIHELLLPQQWPTYLSLFGFLLPVVWLQRRWIRNPGIYWSCAIMMPLWFAGMMFVGVIPEIRIFSELSAILVPAIGLIVYHRFIPVDRASEQ